MRELLTAEGQCPHIGEFSGDGVQVGCQRSQLLSEPQLDLVGLGVRGELAQQDHVALDRIRNADLVCLVVLLEQRTGQHCLADGCFVGYLQRCYLWVLVDLF